MSDFIGFMWGDKVCSKCFETYKGNVNVNSSPDLCPKCSRGFIRTKKVFGVIKKVFIGIKDFFIGNY